MKTQKHCSADDEIIKCFKYFDEGSKGYLVVEDLKCAITAIIGYRPSKYEIHRYVRSLHLPFSSAIQGDNSQSENVGKDNCVVHYLDGNNERLDLDGFIKLVQHLQAVHGIQNEVRQMFQAFDRGCQGFLTEADFQEAFVEASGGGAPHYSADRVSEFFKEVDTDGGGRIGYQAFERLMLRPTDVPPPGARGPW
mmetsp:Transcript_22786/g.33059  ORF Transcript_22786/g.33059 Transcript_22786/m.33059 type:complete len:194 (-) Transcript_22786:323-904(-)